MPGISIGGLGSGLPPNIVDQLIEVERIPIKNMETQKSKSSDRLKLVTDLETKITDIKKTLGELANSKGFADIKLLSGDPNIVQGSVDPATVQPGSWNIEVVQLAQKASAITNGFADKDKTEIGVGYFKFRTADGYKDVYINGSNNTLEGAASAINAARIGVRASVINDRREPDAPFKLVISADAVGTDNKVEYPTLYFLDGDQDLYFDEEREAANGIVKIDGFEFEVSDNTLKDMIPGVTLELKQASPGHSVNVSVKEDLDVVTGKIKTFVEAMNQVFSFIQQQNKLDKKTDTTRTLGGDSLLRSIEQRMRSLVLNPQLGVKGSIKQLNQVGITFNRNGLLEFDEKKFNGVLGRQSEAVHSFFVGDGLTTGFVSALRREIGTLTNSAFGPLANRRRGLEQKIDQIDGRIEMKERQLSRREEQLRAKFAKLDETMNRMKSQGASLSAAGFGGNGGGGGGAAG